LADIRPPNFVPDNNVFFLVDPNGVLSNIRTETLKALFTKDNKYDFITINKLIKKIKRSEDNEQQKLLQKISDTTR
jgi:hypothetical protein